MDWLATLRRSGGLHALARKLEASPADVMSAAGSLLPHLLDAMRGFVERHGGEEAGVKALAQLLSSLGDGDLAAEVMGPGPLRIDAGKQLLSDLIPCDPSDDLVTGDPLQAQLFPGLAMLVGGYLGARAIGSDAEGRSGLEQMGEMLELDWPRRRRGAARWNQGN